MNQGIAFARTLRALDADDFRASKLGLLAAAMVLGAWTGWMFAARVPQYETTTNVRVESGRAIAYFPAEVLSGMHSDATALIHIDGVTFSARVQSISADHIDLAFTSHQPPATTSSSASAEVEVTRISPAAIALQTLGRARR